MKKVKEFWYKARWGVALALPGLFGRAVPTWADTATSTSTDSVGALPQTNPFQVDWNSIMNGDVAKELLPLANYALGIFGLWLLFHGSTNILHFAKKLMKGEVGFKEIIPIVSGFVLVIMFLSGGWYYLLLGVMKIFNASFQTGVPG